MDKKFSEFRKFRESDKSLKHELDSVKGSSLHLCLAGTVVVSWSLTQEVGSILVSYTGGGRFE